MRLSLVIALLSLSACGPGDRLNGTIRDRASLFFVEVQAQFLVDRLSLRYLDTRAGVTQEPVRVTLPTAKAVTGVDVDLSKGVLVEHFSTRETESGLLVAEEPFPAVKEGVLTFTKVSTARGQSVEGEFHLVFAGALDTLNGDFTAIVVPP